MTYSKFKKHLGEVIEVCWLDAHSTDPWTPIEDLGVDMPLEGLPCRTYGVCVATNVDGIMVSGSINGATSVGASWFIPAGMVTQIRTLISKKGLNL